MSLFECSICERPKAEQEHGTCADCRSKEQRALLAGYRPVDEER